MSKNNVAETLSALEITVQQSSAEVERVKRNKKYFAIQAGGTIGEDILSQIVWPNFIRLYFGEQATILSTLVVKTVPLSVVTLGVYRNDPKRGYVIFSQAVSLGIMWSMGYDNFNDALHVGWWPKSLAALSLLGAGAVSASTRIALDKLTGVHDYRLSDVPGDVKAAYSKTIEGCRKAKDSYESFIATTDPW